MDRKPIDLLLVEDDAGDRRLIQLALKELSPELRFTVKTAETLADGLECLENGNFGLVLLDLGLPDSDGLDSVAKVCRACLHIPVIVMTGLADERMGVEAIKKGASDYLTKDKTDRSLLYRAIRYSIERKQAEELLKQATRAAEAASEAKGQFLANMSHEIRTPMNAIIGFSDMLAEEELADEQKNEYVNIIRESSQHLLGLINDILDFSKIEAGKLDTEMAECSLKNLFAKVESIIQPVVLEKGLKFEIREDGRLPASIRTDSGRLQQCLINLASNAVKFSEEGQVCINVSLENRNKQPYIRFDVEDTGVGIPPEKQQDVFESFTQADGSATRKYGGSGLGLAITRHLAELLGGDLTLSSEQGKGSMFSLAIPAGLDVTKQAPLDRYGAVDHTDAAEGKTEQPKFSGSVLVAEDAKTNQVLVKTLLSRMGLEVTIAADGNEAVQMALAGDFDLILMDIQMPRMNGYRATKAIRKQAITTPIVALTAHAMKGDDQKCIEAGCDDYLAKPLDRRELLKKICKYLPAQDQDVATADAMTA